MSIIKDDNIQYKRHNCLCQTTLMFPGHSCGSGSQLI